MIKFVKSKITPNVIWLFYSVVLLLVCLPNGFDTVIDQNPNGILTPTSNNQLIQDFFGGDDRASYARGGKYFLDHGSFDGNRAYINLWAPAMFWLHALLLLMGKNAPVAFFIVLISSFLWGRIFCKIYYMIKKKINTQLSFIIPFALIFLPQFNSIVLKSMVFASEPFAIGVFALGFLYFIDYYSSNQENKLKLIKAGALFAVSAYFRASFDIYMRFFALLLFFSWATINLYKYIARKILEKKKGSKEIGNIYINPDLSDFIKKTFYVFVIFFILTLPWRIYHTFNWNNGKYMYAYIWMADQQFKHFPNHVTEGGVNASACKVDPKICAEFQKEIDNGGRDNVEFMKKLIKTTKKVLIWHPFEWSYYKWPYLSKYWFKEGQKDNVDIKTILVNSLTLLVMVSIFIIGLFNRTRIDMVCCFIVLTIMVGIIVPHFIIHFEARYLYPMKIMAYIVFLISIVNYFYTSKEIRSTKSKNIK